MPFLEGMGAGLRHFVRNLLRRDRVERELADEIEGYVDLLIEERVARGMSRDDARRAARLEIGRVDQVKEHVRDVRVGAWLDALRQDLRFGGRTLIRRPAFAMIAVLTLGVGMGATMAIFSLIDSILLKPLPFHEPERLTMVWEKRPRFNIPRIEAAPEGAPGQTAVVILSYGLWQRRFGADRGIVGKTIRLDGEPHLEIGFFSPRALAIRTTSNPVALVAAVQREIWAVNPNQTIDNVLTLESIVEGQISDRKVQTGLFTAFAGLALFMAALGAIIAALFPVWRATRVTR